MSLFQSSIEHHEQSGDDVVALMYRVLLLTVVKEMHVCYESERKKREVAELFSNDLPKVSSDVADSQEVERLLLGNALVGDNNRSSSNDNLTKEEVPGDVSDDFILFSEGEAKPSQMPTSRNRISQYGETWGD